MKKVVIAFDIGVTSVGWCVSDYETGLPLINYKNNDKKFWYGVRLFSESSNSDGKTLASIRRGKRELRRQIRRRKLRNIDFIKLLINSNLLNFSSSKLNDKELLTFFRDEIIRKNRKKTDTINTPLPLYLRIQGIKGQKIEKNDILIALYNYLQHRGFFYELEEQEENKQIKIDEKLLPSEIQFNNFKEKGYYVNLAENNNLSHIKWEKEVNIFLDNQKEEISKYTSFDIFKKDFLKIFNRIRDFTYGPGPQKKGQKSEFGILTEYGEDNLPDTTLWEEKIGKCLIFSDQKRSLQSSSYSEIYNFLNLMQNIRNLDDQTFRINKEQKTLLFKNFLLTENKFNITFIKKTIFTNKINLNYDSKNNKLPEKILENTKNISKWIDKFIPNFLDKVANVFLNLDNQKIFTSSELDFIDLFIKLKHNKNKLFYKDDLSDLVKELNKNKNYSDVTKQYVEKILSIKISKEEIQKLRNLINTKSKLNSYSKKAIREIFIPKLFSNEEGNEQQNIKNKYIINLTTERETKTDFFDFKNQNMLNELKDLPISPSSKRAVLESLKIFNAIKKRIKNIKVEKIVIEVAREKNSDDERKKISKLQKLKEKNKEQLVNEIKQICKKIDNDKIDTYVYKYSLWKKQNEFDPYELNKKITLQEILNNQVQVEHILPERATGINANWNKVLTHLKENREKKERTPYEWLKNSNWGEYKKYWKEKVFKKIEKKDEWEIKEKINALEFEGNIKDYVVEFGGSKLQDTRIATQFVKKFIEKYIDCNIETINGKITNLLRNKLFYSKTNFSEKNLLPEKDRNFYRHHADDALVLAYISSNSKLKKWIEWISQTKQQNKIDFNDGMIFDKETGELIFDLVQERLNVFRTFKNYFERKKIKVLLENEPYFSRLIEKNKKPTKKNSKAPIELFDETLYSGIKKKTIKGEEEKEEKIIKIKKINLLLSNKEILSKYFGYNPVEKNKIILKNKSDVFTNDEQFKQIYNSLNEIYIEYSKKNEKQNPFVLYYKETQNKNKIEERDKFLININGRKIKIRDLYIIGEEKPLKDIFVNKKLPTSKNKISFCTSLKCTSWFVILSNSKYKLYGNNVLNGFKTPKNVEKTIYKGEIYVDENNDYWYVTGAVPGKKLLEIKPLKQTTESKLKPNKMNKETESDESKPRKRISLESFLKKYKKSNFSLLGEKK